MGAEGCCFFLCQQAVHEMNLAAHELKRLVSLNSGEFHQTFIVSCFRFVLYT